MRRPSTRSARSRRQRPATRPRSRRPRRPPAAGPGVPSDVGRLAPRYLHHLGHRLPECRHRARAVSPHGGDAAAAPGREGERPADRTGGECPMTDTRPAPRFSTDELARLLVLLEGADSVELKLTVPDGDQRSAARALHMDPLNAEVSQVFFLDTPDLLLNERGVIVRARRTRAGDDSVVKLRPVVPQELPDRAPGHARLRRGGRRHAGRLRVLRPAQGVTAPGQGAGGCGRRPAGAVAVHQGAARLLRRARAGRDRDRRPLDPRADHGAQAEVQAPGLRPPAGGRAVDLPGRVAASWSCPPSVRRPRRSRWRHETRVYLEERGIDLSGEQATKTKTALEFFAH